MENATYKILTLRGKLIGLSDARNIQNGKREFKVSQATFLVETPNGLRYAYMFLWDFDARRIRELSLGSSYEFCAIVKESIDQMIMFYVPEQTRFRVIVDGEGMRR